MRFINIGFALVAAIGTVVQAQADLGSHCTIYQVKDSPPTIGEPRSEVRVTEFESQLNCDDATDDNPTFSVPDGEKGKVFRGPAFRIEKNDGAGLVARREGKGQWRILDLEGTSDNIDVANCVDLPRFTRAFDVCDSDGTRVQTVDIFPLIECTKA